MKRSISIFLVIGCLLMLFSACKDDPPPPTPTPIPEPVAEVIHVEDLPPADTCADDVTLSYNPGFPIVYCDNFEDPATVKMPIGEDENKYGAVTMDVYKGKYTTRVEVKRDNLLTIGVPDVDVRDFVFQIDGRLASHSGHPYHSWGVYFKLDAEEESYYYFMIDNNEYYYFQLIRGDRQTNLINGRRTEDLNPLDEGNTITVICEDSTYTFYINGEYQEDFSDNRLITGGVGIYSQMRQGTTLDWEFDDIVVATP